MKLFHETQTDHVISLQKLQKPDTSEGPTVHGQFICAKTDGTRLACPRCIDFTLNAQNDYHVNKVCLRFIRICKYNKKLLCAHTRANCLGYLGTSLSDTWKSHSTVQSGIIDLCVTNFNNIHLISFFLGAKEREGGKGNKDFLKEVHVFAYLKQVLLGIHRSYIDFDI